MSFGAGMGAGMGAGIGAGIAIGMSAGRKRACEEFREYFQANGITLQNRSGELVDPEVVLSDLSSNEGCSSGGSAATANKTWTVAAVLVGALLAGAIAFLAFQ